jgi:predicted ABC-type transport system involved in lysophospholipase L1 biosynthesis ATPase subunit
VSADKDEAAKGLTVRRSEVTATSTEADHLVRAVNVTKAFGTNEVLKGIDLAVDAKEVVCLLGPSGSGKTTFLRLINQMEILTGGRIWVGGELIGIEDRNGKLHVRKDKGHRTTAISDWHGLPALQSLPAHDRPRERDGSAGQGQAAVQGQCQEGGARAAGHGRPRRTG